MCRVFHHSHAIQTELQTVRTVRLGWTCVTRVYFPSESLTKAAMQELIAMLVMFWISLASVTACAQNKDQQPTSIRPVEGATIFRDFCASCHRHDARGKGPMARSLKQEVPDLTRLSTRNGGKFPAAYVRRTLMFGVEKTQAAHGSSAMPIWGPIFHAIEFDQDLGNVRIENLTKYLESMQRK